MVHNATIVLHCNEMRVCLQSFVPPIDIASDIYSRLKMLRGIHTTRQTMVPVTLQQKTPTRRRMQQGIRRGLSMQPQAFFNFNKNAAESNVSIKSRTDFDMQEVEDYFNYMGMLAAAGNYDSLDVLMESGLEPVDILLLMACIENDFPKVEEVLGAGADVSVKNPADGKTPMELCTKEDIKELLSSKL